MCACASYEDIQGSGVVDPRILSLDNEWCGVTSFAVGWLTTSINLNVRLGWVQSQSELFGKVKILPILPSNQIKIPLFFFSEIHTLHRMCYTGLCIPSVVRFPFLIKVCFFCSQNDCDKKFAGWDTWQHINRRQANFIRGLQEAIDKSLSLYYLAIHRFDYYSS